MRTTFPACSIFFITLVIQVEDGRLSQSPVTKQSHSLKGQIDFRLSLTTVGRIMRSLSFFLLWPTSWSRVSFVLVGGGRKLFGPRKDGEGITSEINCEMRAYKSSFQEESQISYKKPSSSGSGRRKLTLPPDHILHTFSLSLSLNLTKQ